MTTERDVVVAAMADVRKALSDELCRLTAWADQIDAHRRDLLTPVANIPIPKEAPDVHD